MMFLNKKWFGNEVIFGKILPNIHKHCSSDRWQLKLAMRQCGTELVCNLGTSFSYLATVYNYIRLMVDTFSLPIFGKNLPN